MFIHTKYIQCKLESEGPGHCSAWQVRVHLFFFAQPVSSTTLTKDGQSIVATNLETWPTKSSCKQCEDTDELPTSVVPDLGRIVSYSKGT
jgi:hypothetical protein